MVLFSVPREQAMAVLGAMRAVVDTDGKVADAEAKLLEATARLLAVDVPVSDLKAVTPAEAAAAVTDPAHRTMLVLAMIVAAMACADVIAEVAGVERPYHNYVGCP